jgi:hypothetical protein
MNLENQSITFDIEGAKLKNEFHETYIIKV